jgi:hypothetical protein
VNRDDLEAILALQADLYRQLRAATQQIIQLQQEITRRDKEAEGQPETTPDV